MALVVTACGPETIPLPPVNESIGRLDVAFGMRAAELIESREELWVTEEGDFQEISPATEVTYGFTSQRPDLGPAPTSRLLGVVHHVSLGDSVRLLERWRATLEGMRSRIDEPVCYAVQTGRASVRRAEAGDTVRVHLQAEIMISGDGQDHEAHLTTSVFLPEWAAGDTLDFREAVPCG